MAEKRARRRTTPKELTTTEDKRPPVVTLTGNPETDPEAARQVHANAIPGVVYGSALRQRLAGAFAGLNLEQSALTYADDLIRRMAPRDPMEEMLIVQALMAHVRVMHLTSLANSQERLESIRTVHEYADRASNTYRRLMLALAEYRKPPRGGDSFTAIKQANIAGQQVVMNAENHESGNATNEQGCDDDGERHATPPVLSADPPGVGIPSGIGGLRETLEAVNRPPDTRGEGSKPHERMEAR